MTLATDALSGLGTALVACLLLSQAPAFWKVIRVTKNVEHLSVLPSVGQMANFASQIAYALSIWTSDPDSAKAVMQVNALGTGISLVYLFLFVFYAQGAQRQQLVRALGVFVIVMAAVLGGVGAGVSDASLRSKALGWVAMVANVIMYAAPVDTTRRALTTMDPSSMPLLLLVANTLVAGNYMALGLLLGPNWVVCGPNLIGTPLGFVQVCVAVYITLRVRADPDLPKRKAAERAGLSTAVADTAADPLVAQGGGYTYL